MLWTTPTLTRAWDPFAEAERLRRRIGRELEWAFGPGSGLAHERIEPRFKLWTDERGLTLTAELPGIDAAGLDLALHENVLTIRGERAAEPAGEADAWHLRERPTGAFARSIELPIEVDANQVDARYERGVLTVRLGRPAAALPRKIEIKTT